MTYKQCIVSCAILMFSFSASSGFANVGDVRAAKVQIQVENSWKLPAKPLDIVYSLDSKKVFILTNEEQVLIYNPIGELIGKVEVDDGVSAIDIAPRGEKLYLINKKVNSFTEIAVDFVVSIDTTGSPYLGNENAPVVLAVFTDFE